MAIIIDFRKATAAVHAHPFFGEHWLGDYRELREHVDAVHTLSGYLEELSLHPQPQRRRVQLMILDAHERLMERMEKCLSFLGRCIRNEPILAKTAQRIAPLFSTDWDKGLEKFTTMDLLDGKITQMRNQFFESSRIAAAVLDPELLQARARESDAFSFCNTFLVRKPRESDFSDWFESTFWNEYGLPLDVFPRKPGIDQKIKKALHSMDYAYNLLHRLRNDDFQVEFAFLTLDVPKPEHAQLRDVYKLLHAHVPSFTPSKAAFDFNYHPAGPQRA